MPPGMLEKRAGRELAGQDRADLAKAQPEFVADERQQEVERRRIPVGHHVAGGDQPHLAEAGAGRYVSAVTVVMNPPTERADVPPASSFWQGMRAEDACAPGLITPTAFRGKCGNRRFEERCRSMVDMLP